MPRLRHTAAANDSFAEIARYIRRESGSASIARRFTEHLRRRCSDLPAAPFQLGRPQPELHPDIWSIAVGNYVIFFRYREAVFEVVEILEGIATSMLISGASTVDRPGSARRGAVPESDHQAMR